MRTAFRIYLFSIAAHNNQLQNLTIYKKEEGVQQGYSISGPRAKCGPRRPVIWPAEPCQNVGGNQTFFLILFISKVVFGF